MEENVFAMLRNNELPAGHERVRNKWGMCFHTQNKASLHTCELSYCFAIVNWQESQGVQLCNRSVLLVHEQAEVAGEVFSLGVCVYSYFRLMCQRPKKVSTKL